MKSTVESHEERLDALDTNTESSKGRIQALEDDKWNKIYFSAYNDGAGEVTGLLKFPKIVVNLGNAFDGANGVFTAPVKGVYTFSFSGQQGTRVEGGDTEVEVYVKRNGEAEFAIMDDENSSGYSQRNQNINSIFTLELDENDEITLAVDGSDYMFTDTLRRLIFTGHLIVET